jgi:hypothetical protein
VGSEGVSNQKPPPKLIRNLPHPSGCPSMSSIPMNSIETRSLPTLTHCFPRSFTFHVAHPMNSIVEDLPWRAVA